jgi:hypothetical protein
VEHCPPFAAAASYRVKVETQADPLSDLHQVFLSEVEQRNPGGAYAHLINELRAAGHLRYPPVSAS